MDFVTYRLSFPNGTFYFGSTNNPRKRFNSHKTKCKSGKPDNHKLQTAWKTFGNPDLQVLNYYASKEEAVAAEQELITEYFGTEECLNISRNAVTFYGTPEAKQKANSPEAKAKLSASLKGKPKSAEHRANMSASRKTQKAIEQFTAARKNSQKVCSKPLTIGTQTFASQVEAAKHFGVTARTIGYAVERGTFRGVPATRN